MNRECERGGMLEYLKTPEGVLNFGLGGPETQKKGYVTAGKTEEEFVFQNEETL